MVVPAGTSLPSSPLHLAIYKYYLLYTHVEFNSQPADKDPLLLLPHGLKGWKSPTREG